MAGLHLYRILSLLIFCGLTTGSGFSMTNLFPQLPDCGVNEEYRYCPTKCTTCCDRGNCGPHECIPGCDCKPNYYRIEDGGPCVAVSQCPELVCGENEVFQACGPRCEYCGTFQCQAIDCSYKCYCKQGYLRNKDGVCVLVEECPRPSLCPHHEIVRECGPVKEYCGDSLDDEVCVSKCYCLDDHQRNFAGHCIDMSYCPEKRCFGEDKFYERAPVCNTTCRNYGDPECVEPEDNCYRGCFCADGMVMNDDGECVLVEDCVEDSSGSYCSSTYAVAAASSGASGDTDGYDDDDSSEDDHSHESAEGDDSDDSKDDDHIDEFENDDEQSCKECKHDEECYDCIPNCTNTCENYGKHDAVCSYICIQGCYCRKDLVSTEDGRCVSPEDCPKDGDEITATPSTMPETEATPTAPSDDNHASSPTITIPHEELGTSTCASTLTETVESTMDGTTESFSITEATAAPSTDDETHAESSGSTEAESSGSAEAESSGSAEAESSGSAEAESSGSAEAKSSSSAEAKSSSSAEAQSSSSAEAESSGSAEAESSGSAEAESSGSAEAESSGSSEAESSSSAEAESSSSAEAQSSGSAEAESSSSAEAESSGSAESESSANAEAESSASANSS